MVVKTFAMRHTYIFYLFSSGILNSFSASKGKKDCRYKLNMLPDLRNFVTYKGMLPSL